MAFSQILAKLGVQLGLDTASFETGARKAQQQAKGLETGLGKIGKVAGAIGAAFLASGIGDLARGWADATKQALEFAGGLGETAMQLGVTTDELQEYRFIASQVGIEQDVMDKGLARLSITLGKVAEGAKKPTEALEQLGFTAKEIADLSRMTAGQALPLLADAFSKVKTPTEQAALAADLFGAKMGGKFLTLLNEGAAGLQRMREEAQRLGIVISEEAIKNADTNADLLTTYEKIAEAQKNAALTLPDNVKAYVEYQKALTDLQVGFYKVIADLQRFNEWTKTVDQSLRDFGKDSGIQGFFKSLGAALSQSGAAISAWAKRTHDIIAGIPTAFSTMVAAIRMQVSGAMRQVWDGAIAKIGELGAKFRWLYDVVVGHSYIPDMVEGIGAWMAKLDALMVKPTEKAADATAERLQKLRSLIDRLFPEERRRLNFLEDRATIENSDMSEADKGRTMGALIKEYSGGMGEPDLDRIGKPLVDGIDSTIAAIDKLTEKSRVGTVKIAKSFADMADQTLQSLSRLTNAIKNGGFFDIVEGLLGLGLSLGQAGVFGKGIATTLNSTPAYATGTNFHPGGMALVGERGPELVTMPRGSRVTPNHALRKEQTVVQLVVGPGQFFVPSVQAISGAVSIEQVTQATKGAHRMQRQAL